MYVIPEIIDDNLKIFAKAIGCKWIGAVSIDPKPLCTELNCHSNVLNYINTYGGDHLIGYYFIKNNVNQQFEAILHSIVQKNNILVDITPFSDDREYNIVGLLNKVTLDDLKNHIVQ